MADEKRITIKLPDIFRQFADMIEKKENIKRIRKHDEECKGLQTIVQLVRSYVHGPMGLGPEVWVGTPVEDEEPG